MPFVAAPGSMVRIQSICGPDDPRVEPYLNVRERDLVGRRGLFIAEGELVVRALLCSPNFQTESILLAEDRASLLDDALAGRMPETPVYLASRAVLDAVAGFPLHRGVLAIGRRGPQIRAADILAALPPGALVLGLIGIANHDNVGGLMRNAAAFGADAVLLDGSSCDPLYRKAIRVSMGAALSKPFARGGTGLELVALLRASGFDLVALSPNADKTLADHRWQPRTALLVGAEGPGLPAQVLERCRPIGIRMAPGTDSLNVATASGIALHAVRQALHGGHPSTQPAFASSETETE